MFREIIGTNLKKIMEEKNISFSSLSKITSISRDHLYHIVNGTKEIGIDTFEKLCMALSVEPYQFFSLEETDATDKLIVNYFRNLGTECWNFSNADTSYLIHGLHNYPAVMIWPISNLILKGVSKYKKIDSLLDPFVGSGTVVVEAQRAGLKSIYGNDLNPLALLITKAKTTLLTEKDLFCIKQIIFDIENARNNYHELINNFVRYVEENFDIYNKKDWSSNADVITNEYFANSPLSVFVIPSIPNLGFWFRPESVITIQIIKTIIETKMTENNSSFLLCSLSEVIRSVSNTRNGEFKLYRKPEKIVREKSYDVFSIMLKKLRINLEKEIKYLDSLEEKNSVKTLCENAQNISSLEENSVDIVITSPPYGDSHTTVAYGQYSKLSSIWLGLTDENIDSKLLGGTRVKNKDVEKLGSPTLIDIYNKIAAKDETRAKEVLDFYYELDASIKEITRIVKKNGYEFWVVGNRTVKSVNIPTDVVLDELGKKYGLKCLDKYYRYISNKVMPSINSPTNISGNHSQTMTSEIILFLKKE